MTKKIKLSFFAIFLFIILAIGTYFIYLNYNKSIKIKFDFENPYEKIKLENIKQEDIKQIFPNAEQQNITVTLFKEIIKQFRDNFKFNDKIESNISLSKEKNLIIVSRFKKDLINKEFKFAETFCQEKNPITNQVIITKLSFYLKIIEKEKEKFELEFLAPAKIEQIFK